MLRTLITLVSETDEPLARFHLDVPDTTLPAAFTWGTHLFVKYHLPNHPNAYAITKPHRIEVPSVAAAAAAPLVIISRATIEEIKAKLKRIDQHPTDADTARIIAEMLP